MLHIPALRYFDLSVIHPHTIRRFKIALIPPFLYISNICKALLYNGQLVVITYELICVVQAATARGKIIVKWDYSRLSGRGGFQSRSRSRPGHLSRYYRKISNIRRAKSQSLNVPRLGMQLFLRNILKLSVKCRMKM